MSALNIAKQLAMSKEPPDNLMCCSVVAGIAAAASVAGAAMSADSSRHAANTQADAAKNASDAGLQATRETNAQQWNAYQQTLANNSPYMQGGQQAMSALQSGLGLSQLRATGTQAIGSQVPGSTQQTTQPIPGQMSPANAGGGIPVAAPNVDANGLPIAQGTPGFTPTNYGASQAELNQGAGTVGQGQFTQTFKPSDLTTDPSYQWRLDQGNKNLQASQAAKGGLLSGQGQKDLVNYGQGAASQEYGAAYDRFMNNQNTLYNRLAGLAGVSQTATNSSNSAGQSTAANMASNTMSGVNASNNYLTSGAAAQAAGAVGQSNAWSGGLNNAANSYMTMQYLNGKQSPYAPVTYGSPYNDAAVSGSAALTSNGFVGP